jgi:hypothetical protein
MAQAGNTPTTSSSSGAGATEGEGQGQQKRKIGGKFDTVEDAVESMLGSYEKNYHETREELGAVKQLLERALTPIGQPQDRGGYDDPYNRGRGAPNAEDEIDPTEFLSTPGRVLQRREAKLLDQIRKQNEQIVANTVGNAAVVLRFQMKNQDLDEHEELVQSFMARTNPRDPLAKRLNEAGKNARIYLQKIRGKQGSNGDEGDEGDAGRPATGEEFIEGAANGRQGAGRQRPANEDDDAAGAVPLSAQDQEFADYLKERRSFRTSRFQAPKT